jgi:DNA-directed RNA polymerase II subunit RPB11
MNAPERSECWRLNDDETKVSYASDTKIPNAGSFTIHKEDHTLGNLIRMQLLQDRQVRFAGYIQPHPLEHHIIVKVQTNGEVSPIDAVSAAVEDLTSELDNLKDRFQEGALRCRHEQDSSRGVRLG